jgi:hypothetical protein
MESLGTSDSNHCCPSPCVSMLKGRAQTVQCSYKIWSEPTTWGSWLMIPWKIKGTCVEADCLCQCSHGSARQLVLAEVQALKNERRLRGPTERKRTHVRDLRPTAANSASVRLSKVQRVCGT